MPRLRSVTAAGPDEPAVPKEHVEIVAAPGSPVLIEPQTLAQAALLTCAHYLPVGTLPYLLQQLTAIEVSTQFSRGSARAARRLERKFLDHMRELLASAPVLHADETPGRANGALTYVDVACTAYLTLMHVADRSAATLDAGGVLAEYTGVLVRDGYASYTTYPLCTLGVPRTYWETCAQSPTPTQSTSSGPSPWPTCLSMPTTSLPRHAVAVPTLSTRPYPPRSATATWHPAHGRDENCSRDSELAAKARTLIGQNPG